LHKLCFRVIVWWPSIALTTTKGKIFIVVRGFSFLFWFCSKSMTFGLHLTNLYNLIAYIWGQLEEVTWFLLLNDFKGFWGQNRGMFIMPCIYFEWFLLLKLLCEKGGPMYDCDSEFVKSVWLFFKHIRNFHVEVILNYKFI